MTNTTLEQMLESLLNDDQAKAEELFHDYVVNRSRDIYESLIESEVKDEEDEEVDESTDEEKDEEKVDEDSDDDKEKEEDKVEEGFGSEAEEEPAFGGDPTDDLAGELDAAPEGEFGDEEGSEFAEKEPVELFQDLETIVDELQAKFDVITGGGEDEFGGEEEMPADAFGGEEEIEDGFDQELATVREYVEKIGAPKMGDNGADTKSVVAGKNDMGGSAANILNGGESKGEGTKGGLADVTTKDQNGGNINVPGGKAGKSAFKKKESGHGAEKKATGDNGENKQSLFRGKR